MEARGERERREVRYERPWLAGYQVEHVFCEERYSWIEASTKSGKTEACIAWLIEQVVVRGGEGRAFWWVAPIINQARIAYRRVKRGYPPGVVESNDTQMEIRFPNGGVIRFLGSDDPDSLYGEDVYAAVIDEASRCREEAYHAVRSTLTATGGPLRAIGNVHGRRNWFYGEARRAESGRVGHHYARVTAYDAIREGLLTGEEVEDARATLPAQVFRELYEAEPSDDQGNPFGFDAIRACSMSEVSDGEPVVWGWDLAKSQDWTVGIALDKRLWVCRFVRFQKPWMETIASCRRETGRVPALIDSTGVGDPIVEALQRGGPNFQGFHFTRQSKQMLMEGLMSAIQEEKIRFPVGEIVRELEAFEYETRRGGVLYTAPDGMHDDCVAALALAVKCAFDRRITGRMPALVVSGGSRIRAPRLF
jgi:hypothetical protein